MRFSESDYLKLTSKTGGGSAKSCAAPGPGSPACKAAATRRRNKKEEGELQKSILQLLETLKIYARRMNSGATVAEYKGEKRFFRYGFPGCPDIMILNQPFPIAFIEVKKEDGELSEDQEDFQTHCLEQGIPHLVARRMDDVIGWLKNYGFRL